MVTTSGSQDCKTLSCLTLLSINPAMEKFHYRRWKNSAVEVGSSSRLLGVLHPTNSGRMSFVKS